MGASSIAFGVQEPVHTGENSGIHSPSHGFAGEIAHSLVVCKFCQVTDALHILMGELGIPVLGAKRVSVMPLAIPFSAAQAMA